MGKRNKVRYQSKPIRMITITLTGKVYLMFRDEDVIAQAVKGDVMVYPENQKLHTTQQGQYQNTGFTGYFKVDVCDGSEWRPVLIDDIFVSREHHFSKTERPIDTFVICEEMLRAMAGKLLRRTYREHYEVLVD